MYLWIAVKHADDAYRAFKFGDGLPGVAFIGAGKDVSAVRAEVQCAGGDVIGDEGFAQD